MGRDNDAYLWSIVGIPDFEKRVSALNSEFRARDLALHPSTIQGVLYCSLTSVKTIGLLRAACGGGSPMGAPVIKDSRNMGHLPCDFGRSKRKVMILRPLIPHPHAA